MDFPEMCVRFKNKLNELINNSDVGINEVEIRAVSKILRNFLNCRLQDEDLHNFLDSLVEYFALLIQYCKQTENKPHSANFNIRMALNIFLFVVDSTNIYDKVFRKVVKIIIKLTEVYGYMTCIKEFLRMYVGIIKKISHSITLQLTNKSHRTLLTLLYSIVKDTNDVELQAVIVDIFLRYIRFNDAQIAYFETVFPEIGNVSLSYPVTSSKGYQTMRMILDKLNANSSKLFSITCSKIMLDQVAVTEFIGANDSDDVWLDIDVEQCRITFFCNQTFLSSFTNINFCNITEWEALSFFTKDVLKVNFEHSSLSESLEIGIKIKTSSFNLFSNVKFDTIRYLLIKISENDNKYGEFVELLPKLFPNFVSTPQLNAARKVVENSMIVSDDDDSSPIIEHFEISTKNKNKIPTKKNRVSEKMDVSVSLADSSSVISISDSDDNEENAKTSVQEGVRRQSRSKVSTKKARSTFNKSVTPISFTESLLGRKKQKLSTANKKNSVIYHSDEITIYKKISTAKERERPKLKISTNLISSVVNKLVVSKPASVNNIKSPIVYMSERESSVLTSELVQEDSLKYSAAKVKTWLKNIEDTKKEVEPEQEKIIENDAASGLSDEEMKDLHSISSCPSNNNSIEKNLMEMFQSQGSNKSDNRKIEEENAEPISKHESVLDMLLTPVDNEGKKRASFVKSEETGESMKNSDEVPLAQLALGLKKREENNLETVRSEVTVKKLRTRLSNKKYLQIAEDSAEEETVLEETVEEKSSKIEVEMENNGEVSRPELEDRLNETVTSPVTVKKNKEVSSLEDRILLNETVTSQIARTKKSSKYQNKVIKNEEFSGNVLKTTVESQSSQIDDSSQAKNKMKKSKEDSFQANGDLTSQISQSKKSSDNPLNRTVKSQSSQTTDSSQIKNQMRRSDETFQNQLDRIVTSQSSKVDENFQVREKIKQLKDISLERIDKPLNQTISTQISQTDNSENRTQDISVLNTTNDPAKKTRRKLYNPQDLTYLNSMITEEFFNKSKTLPNETINNNTVVKTVAKRERRSSKNEQKKTSETKTPKKRGRKPKSESLKCDFSNSTSKMSKPPVTELTFDKAFSNLKETVRKQKKEMKRKKKVEAVRRTKKNVTTLEVSSPSTPPSLEPFGECMQSPRNKRKIPNIVQPRERKRLKRLEESDEDGGREEANKETKTSSKIKVISNIVIRPATIPCHQCLCTEDFGKSAITNFLQFFKHIDQYHPELIALVECMEIYDIMKRHYREN